jgi:UDP-N-acetylmuramate dehydrogenase
MSAAPDEAVQAALAALGPAGAPGAPLGALTTYRVGGSAAVLATVSSEADLDRVRRARRASGLPLLVVGRGSNLLVSDAGFPGIAVVLDPDGFAGLEVSWAGRSAELRVGAALPLPALARRSVEAGVSGLEWAVGVPGSLGGAVRMNAGGHGSDLASSYRQGRVADLDAAPGTPPVTVDLHRLDPGYRRSAIGPSQIVLDAVLLGEPGDPTVGRSTIRDIVRWRREHQPGGQNAGSVFVNPTQALDAHPDGVPSAGWLIEQVGCRGYRRGSAQVSPKHANFIQADPGGSADDVYALMREVRRRVADRFGILLRTEIRLIGFPQAQLEGQSADD